MAITPNSPADFDPTLQGYTEQGQFRFWCQTVLPLVYDDSLSYYELLNKLVVYLNNVISDVGNVETNVSALNDAYSKLQAYVNDYFSTLDVQQEINKKLDNLAASGELTTLIEPYIAPAVTNWLTENVSGGQGVVVDKTLTISDAAADSKIVGETFSGLDNALSPVSFNEYSTDYNENGYHPTKLGYNFKMFSVDLPAASEGTNPVLGVTLTNPIIVGDNYTIPQCYVMVHNRGETDLKFDHLALSTGFTWSSSYVVYDLKSRAGITPSGGYNFYELRTTPRSTDTPSAGTALKYFLIRHESVYSNPINAEFSFYSASGALLPQIMNAIADNANAINTTNTIVSANANAINTINTNVSAIDTELTNLTTVVNNLNITTPKYALTCWGDSLTAGAGSGSGNNAYPAQLAAELGITSYFNGGVGGENTYCIATRAGADTIVLPAGAVDTYTTLYDVYGKNVRMMYKGSKVANIIINGNTAKITATTTDNVTTYTVTNYTGGDLTVPTPIYWGTAENTGEITCIWAGQNGPSDYMVNAELLQHIADTTNGKYVILGLSSGTASSRASQEQYYLKLFGNKFFNTREMLSQHGMTILGLTPTETDEAEIADGTVPTSLRSDNVHLNANGYKALAKFLAAKIRSLKYI